MRTFLQQARIALAPHIDGGSDPGSSKVVAIINEATRRLLNKTVCSDSLLRWWVNSSGGVVTPPREIDGVYGARIGNVKVTIFDQIAEFAGNGPGEMSPDWGYSSTMVNKGISPLYYDIYGCKKLEVVSSSPNDIGKFVKFRGLGGLASDSTVTPMPVEESVAINTSIGYSSLASFFSCNYVRKPVTDGTISVYSYDPTSNSRYLLAIYHKDEIAPEFKRYLIPGLRDYSGPVEILGKKRFIPVANDDDELVIGNLDALKLMCLAIWEEKNQDYKAAGALMSNAIIELEFADKQSVGGSRPVLGIKHLGTINNLQ